METKPRLMPLLPLRGMLVFPGMIINLDVGRERSIPCSRSCDDFR